MTPTPKAQAEAMASKLVEALYSEHLEYDSSREHRFEYHVKTSHTAITAFLSTALEKLLAENERLKKEVEGLQTRSLFSKLTATEARLVEASEIMRGLSVVGRLNPTDTASDFELVDREIKVRNGILRRLRAFLSTLTAEKKEQG